MRTSASGLAHISLVAELVQDLSLQLHHHKQVLLTADVHVMPSFDRWYEASMAHEASSLRIVGLVVLQMLDGGDGVLNSNQVVSDPDKIYVRDVQVFGSE